LNHSTPSPGQSAEIADVLHRTRSTLRRTELASDRFPNAPDREGEVAAMHNVVVTGRAVTNVLQNLCSKAQGFDAWYGLWQQDMRQDPLLRYLYELRTQILKRGEEGATNVTVVHSFCTSDILPAPPDAVAFFIGDENGGNGWEVRLEDGTTQKIYIALPEDKVRSWLAFQKLPREHLGALITDDSLEHICRLYVQYLRRLVEADERHFDSTP
jgi:hypothetical protein